MKRISRISLFGALLILLISVAITLSGCGGGGDGTPPPPNYNALLSGDYQIHKVEYEGDSFKAQQSDMTADGQGTATTFGLTIAYSIEADRTISISFPTEPTYEPEYGIVSSDGNLAVITDAQFTGDVETLLVIKKSTDMTPQKASGEYIVSQAGKDAQGFYTSRVLVVLGSDGNGTWRILDHSQAGEVGLEGTLSYTVSADGTFSVNNGSGPDAGIISPDANIFVVTDGLPDDADGEVFFAVGVRRSTTSVPALSGSFQVHFIGYDDTNLDPDTGPQFAARWNAVEDAPNSKFDVTCIIDSRGTAAGTTVPIPHTLVSDDGTFVAADTDLSVVSSDGSFFAIVETDTGDDAEIKIGLAIRSAAGTAAPVQQSAAYQFYSDDSGGDTGGLFAVKNEAIPKSAMIEPDNVERNSIMRIMGGTFVPSTMELTDAQVRTMVYARNGKLYKVSALNTSSLIPVRVSSEDSAYGFCDTQDSTDFADHERSVYTYVLAGGDGLCDTGDDIQKAVRLNMTMNDAPLEISSIGKKSVGDLYDITDASLLATLVVKIGSSTLQECGADFTDTNCTDITSGVVDAGQLGLDLQGNRTALWIFDGTNYTVHTYNMDTHALSAAFYSTQTTLESRSAQDAASAGGAVYFLEGSNQINRLDWGSSPSVTPLVTGEAQPIEDAKLTAQRLVYVTRDETFVNPTYDITAAIKSVEKTGGTPLELAVQTNAGVTYSDQRPLELRAVAGKGLFFTRRQFGPSGDIVSAGYIWDDGTGPGTTPVEYEILNAEWTAVAQPTTMKAPGDTAPVRVIMAEGDSRNLVSYETLTYGPSALGLVLGTLPAGYRAVFYGGGIGNHIIGACGLDIDPFTWDVFSVQADTAGSLVQLTTTPGFSEWPVNW